MHHSQGKFSAQCCRKKTVADLWLWEKDSSSIEADTILEFVWFQNPVSSSVVHILEGMEVQLKTSHKNDPCFGKTS